MWNLNVGSIAQLFLPALVPLLVVSLILCLYIHFTLAFNYWKDRNVPYTSPILFFLNAKDLFFGKFGFYQMQLVIYNSLKGCKYGGYFDFTKPNLMLRDPELIERILTKDFAYFEDRGLPSCREDDLISLNLAKAEGERWRHLRHKLTPTFTSGKLKSMFDQISGCCDDLIRYIDYHNRKEKQFDGKLLMNRFAMNVTAMCVFGIKFSDSDNERDKFLEMVKKLVKPTFGHVFRMFCQIYCHRLFNILKIKTVDSEAANYFIGLVKETIRFREENNIERNDFIQLLLAIKKQEDDNICDSKRTTDYEHEDALIDQMCHAPRNKKHTNVERKLFSTECITAQAVVFLTGGSDGATGVMNFFLFSIAKNPHVQSRLQKEVDSILAKHNNYWNYQMLKEMTYIDQVIQETMRIYPQTVLLIRKCTKPYRLPDRDVIVEPGTIVTIPVYSLHHDDQYYPEPEKFDPDRFLETNYKPSGYNLPFGDGPRICIAMRFSLLKMKLCLARLCSEYSITLGQQTQTPLQFLPRAFSLQPKDGIWLQFEKRKLDM